jgi:hypothetical protein
LCYLSRKRWQAAPRSVLVHGASGGARQQVIATLRFRLGAGRSKRVTIKLTKPAAITLKLIRA